MNELEITTVTLLLGIVLIFGPMILAGYLAQKKGRSVVGWVIFTWFFSIIPVIILAFLDSKRSGSREFGY